jgi:transcriptional regulator with XRE-family HTH domain
MRCCVRSEASGVRNLNQTIEKKKRNKKILLNLGNIGRILITDRDVSFISEDFLERIESMADMEEVLASSQSDVPTEMALSSTVKRPTRGHNDDAEKKTAAEQKASDTSVGVNPASAEAFIAEKHIGERIKRLRLKKSMGLVELGRQTGLSASFLSQLETGRVVPTLRNLARISMVFGKDLSHFFEAEPQPLFRIHRKAERTRQPQSGVDDPTYYFESLGYMVPERQFDPYFAEFLPLRKANEMRAHVHAGSEFLYVLSGALEIRHADKVHIVEAGDGVYFDASIPHAYRCSGDVAAQVIIVTLHQQSAQQAQNTVRTLSGARPAASSLTSGASLKQAAANGHGVHGNGSEVSRPLSTMPL